MATFDLITHSYTIRRVPLVQTGEKVKIIVSDLNDMKCSRHTCDYAEV